MNLLQEHLQLQDEQLVEQLNAEFKQLEEQFDAIVDQIDPILTEGALQDPAWWDTVLGMAMKRFDAARRGLGLVNKLKPGPDKVKHAKRVMTNMNKIRSTIASIEKKIHQTFIQQAEQGKDQAGFEKPMNVSKAPQREPRAGSYMDGVLKHAS